MKTITIEAYTFSELDETAKAKVINRERENMIYETYWNDEIIDSMEAFINAITGIELRNWHIDIDRESNVNIQYSENAISELSGARAFAYLENNCFVKYRITQAQYLERHKEFFKWKYNVGMIKPCPFTGVCYDHDFIDSVMEDLKQGYTLGEALNWIADKAAALMRQEREYRESEQYISEMCDMNEYLFTEDGELIQTI